MESLPDVLFWIFVDREMILIIKGNQMSRIVKAFLENERGLKRFIARLLPRTHDVEEIAQETFLRAFAAEASEDVQLPRAYLYRTARNLALNEKARLASHKTDPIEDFPDPDVLGSDHQPDSAEEVDGKRKMAIFAEAISALPPQCRQVFLLRKVHGLSQKAVAEQLSIAPSTVEKHVALGLLRCSEYMRQRGYELSGPAAPKVAREKVPDKPQMNRTRNV
jgi:RNA polymerase sigma-70 factor (ECF subfamily)